MFRDVPGRPRRRVLALAPDDAKALSCDPTCARYGRRRTLIMLEDGRVLRQCFETSGVVHGPQQGDLDIEHSPLSDDQRKHLDFVQAVIARLASSSTATKGWGLTIATAAFGFSATKAVPVVAGLGLTVVIFFGVLDSYYLREERLFRYLYDDARRGLVEVYSMNKNDYAGRCTRGCVFRSWSVCGFYGPLLLVGLAALVWSLLACPQA